jgi:hypothetical protein
MGVNGTCGNSEILCGGKVKLIPFVFVARDGCRELLIVSDSDPCEVSEADVLLGWDHVVL